LAESSHGPPSSHVDGVDSFSFGLDHSRRGFLRKAVPPEKCSGSVPLAVTVRVVGRLVNPFLPDIGEVGSSYKSKRHRIPILFITPRSLHTFVFEIDGSRREPFRLRSPGPLFREVPPPPLASESPPAFRRSALAFVWQRIVPPPPRSLRV